MKQVFCLNRVSVDELQPNHGSNENFEVKETDFIHNEPDLFSWMNYKGLFTGLAKIHYL